MIDSHTSLAEKFIKKGFWLYLFSFIIAPIGYIIKIIISGELSVSEVGILYGVISLITLISSFSDFWIPESLKHYIPQYIKSNDYARVKSILVYGLILQFFSSALLFWVFFSGSEIIASEYFKAPQAQEVLQTFSLYFLWINFFQIITQFFFAIQNTFLLKLSEFFRSLTLMIWVIILFLHDSVSLEILPYLWVGWLFIGVFFAGWVFYKKYYIPYLKNQQIYWHTATIKKILSYAIASFLAAQAASLLSQIDMQMIIWLLDVEAAGYYTIYLSIISICFLLFAPIFPLVLPIISQLYAHKDTKQIVQTKNMLFGVFGVSALYISCFMFLFGEMIAFVLFWEQFIASGVILKYCALFIVCNFFLQINYNILWGIGKVSAKFYITSIALIINIILNFFLISYIWVYWAALATWITWLFIFVMSEYVLWKYIQFKKHFIQDIFSNIPALWLLSLFSYYSLHYSSFFEYSSRLDALAILWVIALLWSVIFLLSYKKKIIQLRKKLWK